MPLFVAGIHWEVLKDFKIKEEFFKPYKPSDAEKLSARDDKFVEKHLFNLIDSCKKTVDNLKMLRPKMTAFTPLPERRRKDIVQSG